MPETLKSAQLSRRRFVQGMTAGGLSLLTGLPRALAGSNAAIPELQGNYFRLTLGAQMVHLTGRQRLATTVNGSLPGPLLRWRAGERVVIDVTNQLPVSSSIHWHGMILPSAMDGVPHISDGFHGIAPGETFRYEFDVRQSGTYWYHSHSGFQEQTGLYGAIVIDPADKPAARCERDYVVVLSDWSDEAPLDVYTHLKQMSHYYNTRERTLGDLWSDIRKKGVARTWDERSMWNNMRMSDRDISDVTGMTYTFLMNGRTPADNWTALFASGERVRLRFINAAAMTFFDVRIPGLKMRVVAADGQDIEPVSVDEFRIGVAETYDVIIEPCADTAYSIFAQAIDRSGYACGTITPDPALHASVPEPDPYPVLSHADMGMAHDMAGHEMHMQHEHHAMPGMLSGDGSAGQGSNTVIQHGPDEYGPQVDMRSENPRYRLDDPGVGLRNNGRAVLTYADLRNAVSTPDPREPSREIQLHLTGNMSRYMWSIDGIAFADAEPLPLHLGERLRITLVNDTMMNHPMHLHGMWSDLETGEPACIPRKHTVIVQPGSKLSYLVTADAPGHWAYHCHMLYHMLGMFREVVVN